MMNAEKRELIVIKQEANDCNGFNNTEILINMTLHEFIW